ncbi:hypothetical protein OVA24_17050 [Luteolibacter sp. SL250]|uniref:hypothetical protein n=1 Tax=Luteolibacter sp. SL250 TaxID=2995170 RepID=UPI00226F24A0|nr:hypothetical protein [Luteolibacter sp. SL250]WAC18942.1 hypothetical protein OVA24_17050 [Luteolibacter sp. SL250]
MNGRRLMALGAVSLLAVMAALVVLKAKKEAYLATDAGVEDVPREDEELLRMEREGREAGVPLEPERAREKMREAMAAPEENVRARMAGGIIRDLCLAGYVEDAWKMVDPAEGQVRDVELMAYFRYAKLDPAELLEKAGELREKAEVRRALDGYLSGGTLEDVAGVMALPGFADRLKELEAGYPPDMKPVITELVRDRLHASRSDVERDAVARFTRRMFDLKAVGIDLWMEVTKLNDLRDAFERWEEMRALTEGTFQEGHPQRSGMLQKLVTEDGPKAMSVLVPRDDRQGRADLVDAVRLWYERDWPNTGRWLEEHAEEMNPEQRDAVYAGLAEYEASAGDAAKARKWAEKVADAGVRGGLLLDK